MRDSDIYTEAFVHLENGYLFECYVYALKSCNSQNDLYYLCFVKTFDFIHGIAAKPWSSLYYYIVLNILICTKHIISIDKTILRMSIKVFK